MSWTGVIEEFQRGGLWLLNNREAICSSSWSGQVCLAEVEKDLPKAPIDAACCTRVIADEDANQGADLLESYPLALFLYPQQLMKYSKSPVKIINRIFPTILLFLRQLCEAQNPAVLISLVRLWCAFTVAAKLHRTEDTEMLTYAMKIEVFTNALLSCNALNDPAVFARLILPKEYWLPIKTHKDHAVTITQQDVAWSLLHVFEEGTPIRYSLDNKFKLLLASPSVVSITETSFYRCTNIKAV